MGSAIFPLLGSLINKLHSALQFLPRFKRHYIAGLDLDGFAGLRVTARTSLAPYLFKRTQPYRTSLPSFFFSSWVIPFIIDCRASPAAVLVIWASSAIFSINSALLTLFTPCFMLGSYLVSKTMGFPIYKSYPARKNNPHNKSFLPIFPEKIVFLDINYCRGRW